MSGLGHRHTSVCRIVEEMMVGVEHYQIRLNGGLHQCLGKPACVYAWCSIAGHAESRPSLPSRAAVDTVVLQIFQPASVLDTL